LGSTIGYFQLRISRLAIRESTPPSEFIRFHFTKSVANTSDIYSVSGIFRCVKNIIYCCYIL